MLASYVAGLRKQGIISQVAAVFLGATVCTVIGLWFVADLLTGDMISTGILGFTYLLFTVTYCTISSLTFQPKRIVSPTYIQIVTVPILFMLMISVMFWKGVRLTEPTWQGFASAYGVTLAAIMLVLFVVAYIFLSPLVRYLVGLLGTKDDLLVTQLLVHADHNKVLGRILDADFQYAIGIRHQEEARHNIELRIYMTVT